LKDEKIKELQRQIETLPPFDIYPGESSYHKTQIH